MHQQRANKYLKIRVKGLIARSVNHDLNTASSKAFTVAINNIGADLVLAAGKSRNGVRC
jgi:hypothetical protein